MPLFSARTGKQVRNGDDDKSGYGPELIQDPDAALSPEEWEKKYGEEIDTSVLYDEKVRVGRFYDVKCRIKMSYTHVVYRT